MRVLVYQRRENAFRRVIRRMWCRWARLTAGIQATHPARLVMLGYLGYIVAGWALLCLPFAQHGPGVSSLDNLFIATSAVSTTGLTPVSVVDSYSPIGQAIIALLIQLGGIGYMTVGSFVVLARNRELSGFRTQIGQTVFSLPASFRVDKFISSVIKFTALIEILGAVALYAAFRRAGVQNAAWSAVFHSISAFCTAGFSLYNSSFEAWRGDFWINAVIAALSYLGAIGFIVCVDFWRMTIGKARSMTMTSRIILHATFWLAAAGTALFFLIEPSIRTMPPAERLLAAFFQCMTAMTTVGFNSISIGAISKAAMLLLLVLMVIGASPSGTGGGLKVTTFSAVLGVMRSALRGERQVTFWGKPIPAHRIQVACAILGFHLAALAAGAFLLDLTEAAPFDAVLFETASALGTVGLSMGITSSLTAFGKIVVVVLMLCGRVGPLTLGMALFHRRGPAAEAPDSDLAV